MAYNHEKFKPEYVEQARKLCAKGWTDQELADFFGVTRRTILRWREASEAFAEACKLGKDAADERVVESLYKRAVGYDQPEEKIFCYEGQIVRADTIAHYPGDVRAQRHWLSNRRPDEWKDRRTELTGKNGAPLLGEAPRHSRIEIARRIAYQLQLGADEAMKTLTITKEEVEVHSDDPPAPIRQLIELEAGGELDD